MLGVAGNLDGKEATAWAGGEAGLLKSYPKIKVKFDQNVVIDDKVITSNGGLITYQAAFVLSSTRHLMNLVFFFTGVVHRVA